jgi:hypothetical protein
MKLKTTYFFIALLLLFKLSAQNVGINTATPRFPLSFPALNGQKISLYDDGNPAGISFGIGVSNNQLLQIHSATAGDDIAFGIGSSANFMELLRIKGNGRVGIGTDNPSERLDVTGNINVTGTIKANGVDGQPNEVLMKNNSGDLSWGSLCDYKNFKQFEFLGAGMNQVWSIPTGVTKVMVEIWGGGGGGNGIGGGGAGGYIIGIVSVVPGATAVITVGGGGTAGILENNAGNGGESSFVADNPALYASGGSCANVALPGTVGNWSGYNGAVVFYSQKGQTGRRTEENYQQSSATEFVRMIRYGDGGSPYAQEAGGGQGGYAIVTTGGTPLKETLGMIGNAYGAGGGGARTNGGAGAAGRVIVRW